MQRMLRVFLVASLCLACSTKQATAVSTTTSSSTAQTSTPSSAATTTGTIAHSAEDLVPLADRWFDCGSPSCDPRSAICDLL